jgi:hypothetical protein
MLDIQINEIIEQIDVLKRSFGRNVYSSAKEEDEEKFLDWIKDIFRGGMDLSSYVSFSRLANGLNHNGLFFYSITPQAKNNIYDSNEEWWEVEDHRKYLFFADDSISWYCMEILSGEYYVLDKPSGEKMKSFSSFNELLYCALEAAL